MIRFLITTIMAYFGTHVNPDSTPLQVTVIYPKGHTS